MFLARFILFICFDYFLYGREISQYGVGVVLVLPKFFANVYVYLSEFLFPFFPLHSHNIYIYLCSRCFAGKTLLSTISYPTRAHGIIVK